MGGVAYKFGVYGRLASLVRRRHAYEPVTTTANTNRFYDRTENSGLLSNDSNGSQDEDFFYWSPTYLLIYKFRLPT